MSMIRPIDQWFIDAVLPHASAYHAQARRWTGQAETARDIVQEAYARVIAMQGWLELANPKAYMMLVVRNIAIDRLRQARVLPFDRGDDAFIQEMPDDQPDAFARIAARDELARVRAAIENLPPQCRKVVELRKLDDCSPREIAERLAISVSTVEKHLVKGLRLVMATLAGQAEADMNDEPARDHRSNRSGHPGRPVADPARRGNG